MLRKATDNSLGIIGGIWVINPAIGLLNHVKIMIVLIKN